MSRRAKTTARKIKGGGGDGGDLSAFRAELAALHDDIVRADAILQRALKLDCAREEAGVAPT